MFYKRKLLLYLMFRPLLLTGPQFFVELLYSIIIIFSSLFVYWRTQEIYELTSYRSIKYFRNAFLFFGLAYLSRFLLRGLNILHDGLFGRELFRFGFFLFLYLSLVAGLLLIYSILWKHLRQKKEYTLHIHIFAFLVSLLSILYFFRLNLFIILTLLFLIATFLASFYRDKSHKMKHLHIIYLLLFVAWLVNSAAHFFIIISFATGIVLYTASSLLFLIIVYKVIKNTTRKK